MLAASTTLPPTSNEIIGGRTSSFPPSFIYVTHPTFIRSEGVTADPGEAKDVYVEVSHRTDSWNPQRLRRPQVVELRHHLHQHPALLQSLINSANKNVLYFGARSDNGLWRSTVAGLTWSRVIVFSAVGLYSESLADTTGCKDDPPDLQWVTLDTTRSKTVTRTSRIFVDVARRMRVRHGQPSLFSG
jgi:hypothetical protein